MKKEAIIKTGICYWSDADDCYVAESPLFDRTAGVGDTPQAAWKHFKIMVDEALQDIKQHGLYEAPGRPAKGIVSVFMQMKPEVRDSIKHLQKELSVGSQGDVINFLMHFYKHAKDMKDISYSTLSSQGDLSIFGIPIELDSSTVKSITARLLDNKSKTAVHKKKSLKKKLKKKSRAS